MENNKITELLKNYRSYRYAISNGIAPHQSEDMLGMPMGGTYGSRIPKIWGSSGSTFESERDYNRYTRIVMAVDGAVNEVLNDDQAKMIRKKYLDKNRRTLAEISDELNVDPSTVGRWHKEALKQLSMALQFVELPEILNTDNVRISA